MLPLSAQEIEARKKMISQLYRESDKPNQSVIAKKIGISRTHLLRFMKDHGAKVRIEW